MGGHVLYDASITISYIVYYLDSYRCNTRNNKTAITKKKLYDTMSVCIDIQ